MSILKMRQALKSSVVEKLIWGALIVVFVASCFYGYGAYNSGSRGRADATPDSPAVIVNGETISNQVLEQAFQKALDQAKRDPNGFNIMMYELTRRNVMDQLVDNVLFLQEAKRRKIEVNGGDVDKEIDRMVSSQMDQMRMGPDGKRMSDKVFDEQLKAGGTTRRDIETRARSQYASDEVRQEIEKNLYMMRLGDQIKKDSSVSDKEFMRRYQEVTARRILIGSTEVSDAQAHKQATDVADMLRKGGDFAALAAKYSQDKATNGKGGLMTPQRAPLMDTAMEKLLFDTKPGGIGGPAKTMDGYSIVKVEKIDTKLPPNFESVKKKEREQAQQEKVWRTISDLRTQLRASAKIEKKDPVCLAFDAYDQARQVRMADPAAKKERGDAMAKVAAQYIATIATIEKTHVGLSMVPALNARLGMIYKSDIRGADGQPDYQRALNFYLKAKEGASDPVIYMSLASIYRELKQTDKAIEEYKLASDAAWGTSSIMVHMTIKKAYEDLGRKDLVAKENGLLKTLSDQQAREMQAQQQAMAPPPSPKVVTTKGPAPKTGGKPKSGAAPAPQPR